MTMSELNSDIGVDVIYEYYCLHCQNFKSKHIQELTNHLSNCNLRSSVFKTESKSGSKLRDACYQSESADSKLGSSPTQDGATKRNTLRRRNKRSKVFRCRMHDLAFTTVEELVEHITEDLGIAKGRKVNTRGNQHIRAKRTVKVKPVARVIKHVPVAMATTTKKAVVDKQTVVRKPRQRTRTVTNKTPVLTCQKHGLTFDSELELALHICQDLGLSDEKIVKYRSVLFGAKKKSDPNADSVTDGNETDSCGAAGKAGQTKHPYRRRVRFYVCPFCLDKWRKVVSLQKHLDEQHPDGKGSTVICDICGVELKNKHSYLGHIKVTHEGHKYPAEREGRKRVCEICGYTTKTSVRLRDHKLYAHDGIMPYACNICSYTTKQRSQFYCHKLAHEGRKLYNCDYCDYGVNLRQTFVNHNRNQHGVELPKSRKSKTGKINTSFPSRNRDVPVRVCDVKAPPCKKKALKIKNGDPEEPTPRKEPENEMKNFANLETPVRECPYNLPETVSNTLSMNSPQMQYWMEMPGWERPMFIPYDGNHHNMASGMNLNMQGGVANSGQAPVVGQNISATVGHNMTSEVGLNMQSGVSHNMASDVGNNIPTHVTHEMQCSGLSNIQSNITHTMQTTAVPSNIQTSVSNGGNDNAAYHV